MAGRVKKWQMGCGIGCGLLVVILGGVGTCGYMNVRQIINRAEFFNESVRDITAEFGEPGDFVPAADGRIAADRVEAFMAVRDSMAFLRTEVAGLLQQIEIPADGEKSANILKNIQAGLGLVPSSLGMLAERNRALAANGMSVGEYIYLYTLAYYGLLGKSPSDGPSYVFTGPSDPDESGLSWQGPRENEDVEKVRRERDHRIRRHANKILRQVLANQLSALDATVDEQGDVDDAAWRAKLVAETEAMDKEAYRLPWESGMPERIRLSLEPFLTQLDATYDPLANVVELGMNDLD